MELAARTGVLLLTGGPGTGKTTSTRGIVALFEGMGLQVLLLAPPDGPCCQAHERAVPPGGPDHPPGAGYDL